MKIIFLGSFFPKELELIIRERSKGPVANANNALQWSIFKGLELHLDSLEVITLPQIGAFPLRYKELFFKSGLSKFTFYKNIKVYCVNFFNLFFLKHLHRYIQTKLVLTKLLSQTTENIVVIIVYDLYVPFLIAAKKIKKNHQNLKICTIVPDLPFMTGNPDNLLYKIFQNIEHFFLKRSYDSIDLYVLLSKYMSEMLPIKEKPWIVIEGIYTSDSELYTKRMSSSDYEKIIFYSGAINTRNGIINLVDAFRLIPNKNYKLVICGDGTERNYILNASKIDARIIFKGQVTREEVLQLQRESTLLINPRTSDEEFSKYSFPSKTMEYFASGRPVLMYELHGVPEEYYLYCYSINGNNVIELKEKIMMICEEDPMVLNALGKKARAFILENKSPQHQCGNLVKFINENTTTN